MRTVSSGPRKELLKQMLRDSDHPIRTLAMLSHVTGTSEDECRRLLIRRSGRSSNGTADGFPAQTCRTFLPDQGRLGIGLIAYEQCRVRDQLRRGTLTSQ